MSIRVSAGIIRRSDGKILIAQRGEGRKNAHLWEFPGGKQEPGESAEDCLKRELTEELSLPIDHISLLCSAEAQGITFDFLSARTDAEQVRTEHEALRFILPQEMTEYDFCPADAPVARRLAFSAKPLRHFFWDFDGTLIDSYPMMHRNMMRSAAKLGIQCDPERMLELMMISIPHACSVLDREAGLPEGTMHAVEREMVKTQDESILRPIDGIPELLQALKEQGGKHYLYTHRNKSAWELLERFHLLSYFEGGIDSTDGFPFKPAPDALQSLIRRYSLDPETCVMIGDRPIDAQSGIAAGMRGVLIDPVDRFSDCGLRWIVRDVPALHHELLQEPFAL